LKVWLKILARLEQAAREANSELVAHDQIINEEYDPSTLIVLGVASVLHNLACLDKSAKPIEDRPGAKRVVSDHTPQIEPDGAALVQPRKEAQLGPTGSYTTVLWDGISLRIPY
jgi:hypothetical protein